MSLACFVQSTICVPSLTSRLASGAAVNIYVLWLILTMVGLITIITQSVSDLIRMQAREVLP